MKRGPLVVLIVGLVLLVVLLSTHFLYQAQHQRFMLNAHKYATQNIPKNNGWRQTSLKFMGRASGLYPQFSELPYSQIRPVFDAIHDGSRYAGMGDEVQVGSMEALISALKTAQPGHNITLLPGIYVIQNQKLRLGNSGSINAPIIVRAAEFGTVTISVDSQVGFEITGANWAIENLIFSGDCDFDKKCNHGIHLKGNADSVVIVNNDFTNFNAPIKSNGKVDAQTGLRNFPDNVKVAHNRFYNDWARQTRLSVTPLDIVGGDHWLIKSNFIADFSKAKGNQYAYGAFLKGGGRNGVLESNVVLCKWKVDYSSALDARVGLSLGGGGTHSLFFINGEAGLEHSNGRVSGNYVGNCTNDVGIYINNAQDVLIQNNIIAHSHGIDVVRSSGNVKIENNFYHGLISISEQVQGVSKIENTWFWPFQHITDIQPL